MGTFKECSFCRWWCHSTPESHKYSCLIFLLLMSRSHKNMTHLFLDAKLKDAAKMSFGFATVPFCIIVDKVSGVGQTFSSLSSSSSPLTSLYHTPLHCRAVISWRRDSPWVWTTRHCCSSQQGKQLSDQQSVTSLQMLQCLDALLQRIFLLWKKISKLSMREKKWRNGQVRHLRCGVK